jgi:hypothetical protein
VSNWGSYVVAVLIIFVLIAPTQVLGPVGGWVVRFVGPGVLALAFFALAGYLLQASESARARPVGLGALGLGALCGAWWIYRRFVPLYRDQAPVSEPAGEDR